VIEEYNKLSVDSQEAVSTGCFNMQLATVKDQHVHMQDLRQRAPNAVLKYWPSAESQKIGILHIDFMYYFTMYAKYKIKFERIRYKLHPLTKKLTLV